MAPLRIPARLSECTCCAQTTFGSVLYGPAMSTSPPLELLLRQIQADSVEPFRYSRTSFYGRYEPLAATAALAAIAIVGGVLLCESTRPGSAR